MKHTGYKSNSVSSMLFPLTTHIARIPEKETPSRDAPAHVSGSWKLKYATSDGPDLQACLWQNIMFVSSEIFIFCPKNKPKLIHFWEDWTNKQVKFSLLSVCWKKILVWASLSLETIVLWGSGVLVPTSASGCRCKETAYAPHHRDPSLHLFSA